MIRHDAYNSRFTLLVSLELVSCRKIVNSENDSAHSLNKQKGKEKEKVMTSCRLRRSLTGKKILSLGRQRKIQTKA